MSDVTVADGVVGLGDIRVTLSVIPRPPVAFRKNRFRVRLESTSRRTAADKPAGAPLALEGGRISFEMTMPMGEHRYTLVAGADGWQEADVVLPFCKSGNPRWYAIVEGAVAGRPVAARFRVDLTKPSAPQQSRNSPDWIGIPAQSRVVSREDTSESRARLRGPRAPDRAGR
jgi:hypothetical protein